MNNDNKEKMFPSCGNYLIKFIMEGSGCKVA